MFNVRFRLQEGEPEGGAPAAAPAPAATPPATPPPAEGLLAAAAATATPPPDTDGHPATTPPTGAPVKPDWVLEQHWDAAKGEIKYDAVAKSYKDTRAELMALKAEGKTGKDKPPESADKYTFTAPEGLPAVIAEDDPVMGAFRESAHKAGLSQAQFDAIAGDVLKTMSASLPPPVSVEAEKAKLGENAEAVMGTVYNWAKKLVDDGIWSQDEFQEIMIMGSTADGVRALNKVREMSGEARIPVGTKPLDSMPSKEELYAMVGDPKYNTDPAYRKKVEDLFAEVFGTEPAGASQNGLGMMGAGVRKAKG